MSNAQKDSSIILNIDESDLSNSDVSGFAELIWNIDGLSNSDVSGFAELIWNIDGIWIHGFASNIGYFSILHVELIYYFMDYVWSWNLVSKI